MDRASSSSSLLRAVARPPLDPSTCKTPGRWDPSSDSPPERNHRSPRRSASQGRARGHHHHPGAGGMGSSLFMRIVSRTMTPRGMSTAAGLPGRSRLASGTSDHEASSGYSVPGSPAGRAVSLNAPRVSYSSCSVPNSPGQSRNIPQPVSSPHISGSKLGTTARAGGYVPAEATISESTPPDSSFVSRLGLSVHLPPESPGPSFSPEEKAGRLDRGLGPYSPQREYSDRDMTLLSPSASCAVIVFDAESGRITISGGCGKMPAQTAEIMISLTLNGFNLYLLLISTWIWICTLILLYHLFISRHCQHISFFGICLFLTDTFLCCYPSSANR